MERKFQKIFITGASKGIGKALALEYAKNGAVLTLASRNISALEVLADYINNNGGKALAIECDVTDKLSVKNAVEISSKFMDGIDLAILNSGISNTEWFNNYTTDNLTNTINTNLFGVAYNIEYLLPIMKSQGFGTIAGVSSLADFRGVPGSSSYNAAKIALSHLLQAARIELKNTGIDIVTVRFGFVRTDMTAKHKGYLPFLIEADDAAQRIIKGLEAGKKIINFPLPTFWGTQLMKFMPSSLYEAMIKFRKNEG